MNNQDTNRGPHSSELDRVLQNERVTAALRAYIKARDLADDPVELCPDDLQSDIGELLEDLAEIGGEDRAELKQARAKAERLTERVAIYDEALMAGAEAINRIAAERDEARAQAVALRAELKEREAAEENRKRDEWRKR